MLDNNLGTFDCYNPSSKIMFNKTVLTKITGSEKDVDNKYVKIAIVNDGKNGPKVEIHDQWVQDSKIGDEDPEFGFIDVEKIDRFTYKLKNINKVHVLSFKVGKVDYKIKSQLKVNLTDLLKHLKDDCGVKV